MQGQTYQIADPADIDAVVSRLRGAFEALDVTETSTTFTVHDTFDWRLYHKGWQLSRRDRHWVINRLADGRIVADVTVDSPNPRAFYGDFPASEFSRCLAPVLEMRALMPIAEVTQHSMLLNLCNIDRKTVARLTIERIEIKGGRPPFMHCRPQPVRGYENQADEVAGILDEMGFATAQGSPVMVCLEQSGFEPGGYSSKIDVTLAPDLPAAAAVQHIMASLVATMQVNLPGVRGDIDSEFLHDFRVAVRRARSLLGQIKGALDAETTATLQQQLKAIGAMTGNVRDLDVYLLKKTAYRDLVPDFLKPGVVQLFQTLQRKRRHATDRMIKAMAGEDFAAAMQALERFVTSDASALPAGMAGSHPIGAIAMAAIYKRYRRVVKKGRRIDAATPNSQLHALRIDCKKLRYLLEFFASLFPENQIKGLIKQLKQLQENLGDFNDLSVQQHFLIEHLSTLRPQSAQVVVVSAAIGGLVARLYASHATVREQFMDVFARFDSPENRKQFKTLFA
jgi:CHAD domain-containing protein